MLTLNLKKNRREERDKHPFSPPVHRRILKVSSINIELKNFKERMEIVEGFAKLLNSLQYSIQIICDSMIINPEDWKLKEHDEDYYQFLIKLIKEKQIVEKTFYIVCSLKDEEDLLIEIENIERQLKNCRLKSERVLPNEPDLIPFLKPGFIKVGDLYYETFAVEDWPFSVTPGFLSPLYNLEKNITISMFIKPIDNEIAEDYLQRKIIQRSSSAIIKSENEDEDFSGEYDEEIIGAINMKSEINKNEGKFFFMSYYVTVKATSLSQLKKDTKRLKSLLKSMMIKSKAKYLRQDDGYRCSLPHGVDYFDSHNYNFSTTPLKQFFPFISSNIVDKNGIMVGENLTNGSLVFLDHFSYFTANMLVLGKTGSGKSFAIKSQIVKMAKQGIEITVIDTENEFSALKSENINIVKLKDTEEYEKFFIDYLNKVNDCYEQKVDFSPKYLVVDELWKFMKNKRIAEIIQHIIKTGRKRWLGFCGITQEVEDVLISDYAKSLIANSSIKILLKQEESNKELIIKSFGLNENEWRSILYAEEGEGLLFADSKHVHFKTVVSEEQYRLITTKPQDLINKGGYVNV